MLGDSGAQCCSLGFATRSSAYRCNISLQSVALCGFRAFWPGHLPTFMRVRAENWADWRGWRNLQLALVSLDLWANKNLHKLAKYRPNFCRLSLLQLYIFAMLKKYPEHVPLFRLRCRRVRNLEQIRLIYVSPIAAPFQCFEKGDLSSFLFCLFGANNTIFERLLRFCNFGLQKKLLG